MNLLKTDFNDEVIIKNINTSSTEEKRLYDFGIVPGVKIRKVYSSIFGDPCAYEIKKTLFAIRNEDAKYIEVENTYE